MPDGDRSLGGFVLREQIGSGGFGDIFLAEQSALHREAIVKLLREAGDPARVDSFLREAQLASRLDHPYAAHIYAFGAEPDGTLWIAMERVRGASLREVSEAQGPMPIERFVPLLERICEVVQTAHEQGIIHRDLKPDNVMVISRAGRLLPKLLDFGIARATADEAPASTRGVLGSPAYMAPELWIDAKHAGAPADQYALGALAYEALTGRFAFTGATVMEIARAHARGKVAPLGDGFPPALDAVISRALAKKPAERFGNVLELAQAFRDAAGIGSTTIELPQLDEELRVQALANAPQPIADAVASYDAAKNAHQAREAMRGIVRISAWYVGILALACRTRVGSGAPQDSPRARDLLRDLRRQGLTPAGWIALADELTKPFARLPDTYPIPELALLLHPTSGPHAFAPALQGTLAEALGEVSEEAAIQSIVRELPVIASLLRALGFLDAYQVVVPRGPLGEVWMGTRTGPRRSVPLARALPEGQPVVIDAAGIPLLAPWPLMQVQLAVPGHTDQLFLLAGPARASARLTSLPHNFEHRDDTLWDWFRDQLFRDDSEAQQGPSEDSPYKGLASYTRADAAGFFGRERETDIVVNRLKLEPLVAIVGPSGVGKSSFVHAGVAPALDGWQVATTRPGRSPLAHLFGQLAHVGIAIGAGDNVLARLREATRERGLLIVVDQFEELFTLGASADERARFVELLLAPTVDDRIRVAITLRDDFLIRAQQLPGLDLALARGLQLVGPLAPAALERIIVEPLRRAGYELDDPQLPARIVADAGDTPAAVALISFTATRWWELRDRHFHQIPKKAYEAIGGVTGALARHADDTVDALPPSERALVRKAFRHLTTSEGTRAVLARAELLALLGGSAEAERVIERLIESRLVVTSEAEGGAVIEIVHEALLGAWPRLVEWRLEDAEGSRFHEQLRAAARQWDARGRARGLLWRGDALAEYQVWRKRHPDGLTPAEAAFGEASVADSLRGRRIRRALIAMALLVAAVFVVGLWRANRATEHNAAALRASNLGMLMEQGRQALVRGHFDESLVFLAEAYRQGLATSNVRFLLGTAVRALGAHRVILTGHKNWVDRLSYSRDGRRLCTADNSGLVQLWDTKTWKRISSQDLGKSRIDVDLSADGRYALVSRGRRPAIFETDHWRLVREFDASDDAVARLLDDGSAVAISDGRRHVIRVFTIDGALVRDVAADLTDVEGGTETIVTSGAWIAVAVKAGALVVDSTSGFQRQFDVSGRVHAVGISAESRKVLAVPDSSTKVTVWDIDTGASRELAGHSGDVIRASFSPDGRRIATGSLDHTAKVWDADTGRLLSSLNGHEGYVIALAWSADGKRLATGSVDRTTRIWDPVSGIERYRDFGHSGAVTRLEFSPDGQSLATGSTDRTVAIVDPSADTSRVLLRFPSGASSVRFSSDSTRVLVQRWDGPAFVYDFKTQAPVTPVVRDPAPNSVDRLAASSMSASGDFSPSSTGYAVANQDRVRMLGFTLSNTVDSASLGSRVTGIRYLDERRLAVATSGGSVAIVEAGAVRRSRTLPGGGIVAIAVLENPARIVVAQSGGAISILDASTLASIHSYAGPGELDSFAVGPSGRFLVAVTGSSTYVLDPESGRELMRTRGMADGYSVDVSPDGGRIALGTDDGVVNVLDAESGELLTQFGDGKGFITGVAFSPDGSRLVYVDDAGRLSVVDVALERRTPQELDTLLRCRIPLKLTGQRLVPMSALELHCE